MRNLRQSSIQRALADVFVFPDVTLCECLLLVRRVGGPGVLGRRSVGEAWRRHVRLGRQGALGR